MTAYTEGIRAYRQLQKAEMSTTEKQVFNWTVNEIREPRLTRHAVKVRRGRNVCDFQSVRQAFEVFGLKMSRHEKFRRELKANGTAVYSEGGMTLKFSIV